MQEKLHTSENYPFSKNPSSSLFCRLEYMDDDEEFGLFQTFMPMKLHLGKGGVENCTYHKKVKMLKIVPSQCI